MGRSSALVGATKGVGERKVKSPLDCYNACSRVNSVASATQVFPTGRAHYPTTSARTGAVDWFSADVVHSVASHDGEVIVTAGKRCG